MKNKKSAPVSENPAPAAAPAQSVPPVNPPEQKAPEAKPFVAVVCPWDTPQALGTHLETLNPLKGAELTNAIASTLRSIALSHPAKIKGKWFGQADANATADAENNGRQAHTLSSDAATRKKQMATFGEQVKAAKRLVQRVYLYTETRGIGEASTLYSAQVSVTGIVRLTERNSLRIGERKGSRISI